MALLSTSGLRDRSAWKAPKDVTEDEEAHILLNDRTSNNRGFFRRLARGVPIISSHSFQAYRQRVQNFLSLVVFCSDPPFLMYGIIINFWIYQIFRSICWHCHTSNASPRKAFLRLSPIGITILVIFATLSHTSQVSRQRIYSYDLSHVQKNHSFYHMVPLDDSYGVEILNGIAHVSDYMQEKSTVTTRLAMPIEPLPVTNVTFFDNAIRFDFLLEFRQNPQFTSDFGCLIETDVVVDTAYVAWMMTKTEPPPEFLHVQHMWGHRKFEAQNVGLLCVRNKQQIMDPTAKLHDIYLDSWLRIMSFLNNRRYCRLLPKGLMYWLAPNRRILYWDKDGGCTQLYPHCNYVHFARPKKGVSVRTAVRHTEAARMKEKTLPGLRKKLVQRTMNSSDVVGRPA
jgi:hypothetical protein